MPENEEERLRTLADYHLIDTPAEQEFDRLIGLASRLFDVPIVLISLMDRDRQFFKGKVGIDICESSREVSFCAHAIVQDDILFIPDALRDPRFSSNPFVLAPPHIRFYAGKPLTAPNGEKIGTVCLIDSKPREEFSSEERSNLTDLAALIMDRMELHRLKFATEVNQSRFENIAATSPDAIICSNSDGKITFWNRSAEKLFGYSADEIIGRKGNVLLPEGLQETYESELARLKSDERTEILGQTIELSGLRKDGTVFPAEYSFSTWMEGNGRSIGAIVRDVSERRRNEDRLFRLASIDALTDLPNRGAWRNILDETLAAHKPATVLLIDLDGFKEVNDTFGHSAGDTVLKQVATRLRSTCKDAIGLARLGGDEFVALMPGSDVDAANASADALVEALSRPCNFGDIKIPMGASIGVAIAPLHNKRPEDLLGAADLALYKAKSAGRGRYELFSPAIRAVEIARRAFEQELREAYDNGEFELYYQPQVKTHSRELTGAEALMRWNHPERGLLTPASFLEVLSQKPSATEIGDWAIGVACRQAAEWQKLMPGFRMGVNLFEAQFHSSRLLSVVRNALDSNGLPPHTLELEIVENILLHDDSSTLKLLQDLRDLGVGLAFDDYGTGYASLNLLKRYPVSRLKIDRTFIKDVDIRGKDVAVVKAIIYLGRSFGLEVIAEGVETEEQLTFLRQSRCSEAQGYLFGRPVPASEFAETHLKPAIASNAVRMHA